MGIAIIFICYMAQLRLREVENLEVAGIYMSSVTNKPVVS